MKGFDPDGELRRLTAEVAFLQHRIAELRHSRRVLMELLTHQERQQRMTVQQLQLENQRLRRHVRARRQSPIASR